MDTAFIASKGITSGVVLNNLVVLSATNNVKFDATLSVLLVVVFQKLIDQAIDTCF
jgi:hypothetical protein